MTSLLDKLLDELEGLDAPAEIDLMLQPHPGKRITAAHLARARSAAERYMLIAWRFPWLYKSKEEQAGQTPNTLEDIRKLKKNLLGAGAETGGKSVVSSQREDSSSLLPTPYSLPFEADLARLRLIPRQELTKANGTVNLSELARRLGYKPGGGKWDDLKVVAAHLQAEWDEADQLAGWEEDDALDDQGHEINSELDQQEAA